MFIGFDLEEAGLFGSRYFVEHPPVPLDQVALFVTADMIGRSLGGRLHRLRLRHGHRALAAEAATLDRDGGRGEAAQGRHARLRPAAARPERLRPVPVAEGPLPLLLDGREPVLPHAARLARDARLPQARGDQPGDLRRRPRRAIQADDEPAWQRPARQPDRRGPVAPRRPPDAPRPLATTLKIGRTGRLVMDQTIRLDRRDQPARIDDRGRAEPDRPDRPGRSCSRVF